MTTSTGASDDNLPKDPVVDYLTGPPPPRSRIDPSDVTKALAQLQEAARLATAPDPAGKRWVPGLSFVVVAREGDTCRVFAEGHGTKTVEKSAPVGPDTLFPCASLSKPVSTTLLAAAGAGRKPGWEQVLTPSRQTTLRQWLSHRSGMPDHGGDLIEDMNPSLTRNDLIHLILKYQTGVEPGAFRYTNFGFTIGCQEAVNALGTPDWEAFAAHGLIALGMSRSTYTFTSAFADGHADRVLPHQGKPEPPDLLSLDPTGWTWHVVDREHERNPTRQAPAGALLSSAHDLGEFLSAHLRGQFGDFPPRHPPAEDTKDRSYSLGWNVVNNASKEAFSGVGQRALNEISFSHSGAFTLGAGTFLRFDPDAGVGIAVLTNGEPTGVPEALGQLFFKTLYGQPMPAGCDHARLLAVCRQLTMGVLYERTIANYDRYHGKTVPIAESLPQDDVVFRGHSDYYDCDITIERQGADLWLTMGKGPQGKPFWRFPLQCFDAKASTFVYATTGENEVGLSAIRLERDGGVVVRIVDDWLNGAGPDKPGEATGLGVIDRRRSEPAR